ncbi:MAG TPA: tetratricopeptide repeat protein [Phycisphaerae bacterium]|jgi:predicted O-linked N-acetylglucosamine transferase (SPINDLY family)|nr:tetratricopeptide repeat protein [Phycisphaerae bacterium]
MSQLTVDQALQLALEHQRANQLAEAENIFRQILEVYPDQADALHLLGGLYLQASRPDLAEARVRQAIKIRNQPEFSLTLGVALQAVQKQQEALDVYKALVAEKPEFVEAYVHMGVVYSSLSKFEESAAAFQEALKLSPEHLQARGNLGIVFVHLRRYEEAVWLLRSAIAKAPRNADFHASLAAALYYTQQTEAALIECKEAVKFNPQHVQAQNLLGQLLRETGRLKEALEPAQRAAIMMPNSVELQVNYAECLRHIGKMDEAAAHYRTSLARQKHIDLYNNLGNVLKDIGLLDDAIAEYRKALPFEDSAGVYSNMLYTMLYHPGMMPPAIFKEMQHLDDIAFKPLRSNEPYKNTKDPDRKIRLGYVATEFKQHAAGLHILPLLESHDRTRFEIYCYVDVDRPDFFTFRMRQCADKWQTTRGKSMDQLAELIRGDQVDILLDLNQHMGGSLLALYARKPAPIQISIGTGYPGTTGLSAIDYRITDVHLEPPDAPPQPSSEIPLRLSATSWCYHPVLEAEITELPAIANGYITFGNFNNFCKMNEQVFALWAKTMRKIENSRLLMLAPEGSARQRVKACFESHGISSDRLTLANRRPTNEYLKFYNTVDMVLDTFPYDGHQTNLDSFWMGVPVIGMEWPWVHARAIVTQAHCLGLPELVGKDEAGFVNAAATLAADLPHLAELRRTMRDRMKKSPLMDRARYAREVEAHFRDVWQKYCKTEPAA